MLEARFPYGSARQVCYRQHLKKVLLSFYESDFADRKFLDELCNAEPEKFWQSLSEALVYSLLAERGIERERPVGKGPDFLLRDKSGRRTWVEVYCPQRGKDMQASSGDSRADGTYSSPPDESVASRWTAGLKEKTEKLFGTAGVLGFLDREIVGPEDAYVIAINGYRLRSEHEPHVSVYCGINQLPHAVNVAYGLGHLVAHVDPKHKEPSRIGLSSRAHIRKFRSSEPVALISSCFFLEPKNSRISAIWGLDLSGECVVGNPEPICLVHNPHAAHPVRRGLIPADEEYSWEPQDTGHGILTSHFHGHVLPPKKWKD
ncbi:hypothetical protein [Pseudacidovorax sp. RU35E]|uniref:hypothetical protein n=1 Tax=Pseudacidovorax sp. RU35E TaxID=1907403 RepID=UPI00117AEED4|nr:hypothetical protein [Pseudacidovorax sp. RU35E]